MFYVHSNCFIYMKAFARGDRGKMYEGCGGCGGGIDGIDGGTGAAQAN